MKRKVYHLKTCNTSQRIIKSVSDLLIGFEFQDTKFEPITTKQLDELRDLAGSYEALFSRRAKKYKEMGLINEALTEADYKYYLLLDYTFLKRPVFIVDNEIFIGNSKKNIVALHTKLQTL
jgi:arsenate reductase